MKIIDGNLAALTNAASNAGQAQGTGRGAAPGQSAGAGGTDRAEISGLAGKLTEAASVESPERAARVEALRAAVEAGRYQVDAASVARGVVGEAIGTGGDE
jgi:flagellar biosynthesis anti-sigma factor FlgM